MTNEQAVGLVESWRRFPVLDITAELMLAAMAARRRFGIADWDATISEAGRALGCEVVVSEDLSDSQDYAGVRVRRSPSHVPMSSEEPQMVPPADSSPRMSAQSQPTSSSPEHCVGYDYSTVSQISGPWSGLCKTVPLAR